MRTIALTKIWNQNIIYIMGDMQLFESKNKFYLTASPSHFPCIEITWIGKHKICKLESKAELLGHINNDNFFSILTKM